MIKQKVTGFRHTVFPVLAEAFLFLLMLSILEAVYQTPYSTVSVWVGAILLFTVITAVIVHNLVCSYEYRLLQDTLVLCRFVRGREVRRHAVPLRDPGVAVYRGVQRLHSLRVRCRVHRYYLPFFGGVRRTTVLCPGRIGTAPIKLVFKPSDELFDAVMAVLQ